MKGAFIIGCQEIRELVQKGNYYRILSPFVSDQTAWMVVSENQEKALFGYYKVMADPNPRETFFKLKGLDPDNDIKLLLVIRSLSEKGYIVGMN